MIYGTATGEGLHFVAMGVVIPWWQSRCIHRTWKQWVQSEV